MAITRKSALEALNVSYNFHFLGFLLITFAMAAVYLTGNSRFFLGLLMMTPNGFIQRCDLFSGKWVYDNISYPLYKDKHCSFMDHDFACEKYGGKDLNYQQWRWQPRDCDLPRFNAITLLEKLRDNKLVFVGDSMNQNQFVSMLCLIESSIHQPSSKLSLVSRGNSIIFNAFEYNATVEFYWSPLLVESNCDDTRNNRVQDCILRIKAIEKHARYWTDADILIFDSFAWWLGSNMTLLWGSFGSSDAIYKEVELKMRPRVYEMALNTWSDWLENHIRRKTKLFFMSHNLDEQCYNETKLISNAEYSEHLADCGMMQIVESVIEKLKTRGLNIHYLNITLLSSYRKDAHPFVYKKVSAHLTEEQLIEPQSYPDCLHWCLPGVPDIWNAILYAYIMHTS